MLASILLAEDKSKKKSHEARPGAAAISQGCLDPEPLTEVRTDQNLDFRLLASRMVRKQVSAVLSHSVITASLVEVMISVRNCGVAEALCLSSIIQQHLA